MPKGSFLKRLVFVLTTLSFLYTLEFSSATKTAVVTTQNAHNDVSRGVH